MTCQTVSTNYKSFKHYPAYHGNDLGLTYHPDRCLFKIWSPNAQTVLLRLYQEGQGGLAHYQKEMQQSSNGVWETVVEGNLEGQFYTFQVIAQNRILSETPGIYAKAVGVNGQRGAIIDFGKSDPEGWGSDRRPALRSIHDIILYELHVRDITSHPSSGSSYPGKFLGLVEGGTKNPAGLSTGIDHFVEMGITHVHILPSYDFLSIDESKPEVPQFNWGYDPQNYNVPEGSYSTNAANPVTRILEFKQMVKGFHDRGIRVIMDVTYNHTGATEESNFNLESPGYYYRQNPDGSWSDASACGNETASERPMMRKYMLESCKWWVEEYHVDGFRFDLMGIHDIATMNYISEELLKIEPTLFLYGEGWTAGPSPLPLRQQSLKLNAAQLQNIAVFSDDLRDAVKGSVFEESDGGWLAGNGSLKESIKFGIVAATNHQQIDYSAVNYSKKPWSPDPGQTINYVSCHDNHTLFDKLLISNEDASIEEIHLMDKLANAIVLTAQGIPFLHAGVEMLRTKKGVENSFESPDSINQIDWNWKTKYRDHVLYYQGLIALRKAHPGFRMQDTESIQRHLRFIDSNDDHFLAFMIRSGALGDEWPYILVCYNANQKKKTFDLPQGTWHQVVDHKWVNIDQPRAMRDQVILPGRSAAVFFSQERQLE